LAVDHEEAMHDRTIRWHATGSIHPYPRARDVEASKITGGKVKRGEAM